MVKYNRDIPLSAWNNSTLETPAELERLFVLLRSYTGADGLPTVFTAFTGLGNPDFAAIRENDFSKYVDIGLDCGIPSGWERGNITEKMRKGYEAGVWSPEFHSFLHHTSPRRWLKLLNTSGKEGDLARELFDLKCYYQGKHIPEYDFMNVREQSEWVAKCIARFKNIFGFVPTAAVTSDAYPETEVVWAINGIRTICLKNCRSNSGKKKVYLTKLWNNQNIDEEIGNYNPILGAVYLIRNVQFEVNNSAAEVLPVIDRCLHEFNEPAIIAVHRINYVNVDLNIVELRYGELKKLLTALHNKNVYFLTSTEVADLYRCGWSLRKFGHRAVLRKWVKNALPITLSESYHSVTLLPDKKLLNITMNELNTLPCGNYLLEE